jgi:hypothetical protein
MSTFEKDASLLLLVGLMVSLALLLASCTRTVTEPVEWDECYETLSFEGERVTYCTKDTVYSDG